MGFKGRGVLQHPKHPPPKSAPAIYNLNPTLLVTATQQLG